MSKTVVLYHGGGCADGFGAAFAAWLKLGDSAHYIPVQYGQTPPGEALLADRLYILDFSYPRETLLGITNLVADGQFEGPVVTLLDHHKTTREELDGLQADGLEIVFDMEKSGAVLAWEYFHPGEEVPLLLRYVQDRDLWIWKMQDSREMNAFLSIVRCDFAAWDDVRRKLDDLAHFRAYEMFTDMGRGVLAVKHQQVDSLVFHAHFAEVIGPGEITYHVPTVNCPAFLASEVGERLCELHPESPFAATFSVGRDEECWSLRSRSGFDVSKVAEANGGGGHAAAAGFRRKRS